MIRDYPGLGSDKTYGRLREGHTEEYDIETQLASYRAVWAVIEALSGEAGHYHLTSSGEPEPDASFVVILNAGDTDVPFRLPDVAGGGDWACVIDTAADPSIGGGPRVARGDTVAVPARTFLMFEHAGALIA